MDALYFSIIRLLSESGWDFFVRTPENEGEDFKIFAHQGIWFTEVRLRRNLGEYLAVTRKPKLGEEIGERTVLLHYSEWVELVIATPAIRDHKFHTIYERMTGQGIGFGHDPLLNVVEAMKALAPNGWRVGVGQRDGVYELHGTRGWCKVTLTTGEGREVTTRIYEADPVDKVRYLPVSPAEWLVLVTKPNSAIESYWVDNGDRIVEEDPD